MKNYYIKDRCRPVSHRDAQLPYSRATNLNFNFALFPLVANEIGKSFIWVRHKLTGKWRETSQAEAGGDTQNKAKVATTLTLFII